MRVLVLGGSGLLGSHCLAALERAGHIAIGGGRQRPAAIAPENWRELDFAALTTAPAWRELLCDIDAVVNCVGIIREIQPGDFDTLQRAAPIALFSACEQFGVQRVIQLSALGSTADAPVAYWRSKAAADADLLGRALDACVLRPSFVFGAQGASSRLFLALASLPLLALPLAHSALVQPIHVDDLAEAVVKLLGAPAGMPRELAAVGPRALSLADYVGALREGMQAPPSLVCTLPLPLAKLAAGLAPLLSNAPVTADTLTMLLSSAKQGNTADAAPISALLGRKPRDPARFAAPEQRAGAVVCWAAPLLRLALASLWLITAMVSWFGWPHAQSRAWLGATGIGQSLQEPTLLAASLFDAAIGLALLFRPGRWLWPLQLALVAGYTAIMSLCLPQFWLHPFGPLAKNLPLLAGMLMLWRLDGPHKR